MVGLKDLDRKDRLILAELDRNCRQSNAEIARKLRLGKHVVSYRIAQLEKKGVITNYYAVIDMSRLGWQSYRIYLKLAPMEEKEHRLLLDHLTGSQSTWWIGEMDGQWDLGVVVWVPGHYEFERFWNAFVEKFQPFIEQSRVSVYLRMHAYSQASFTGDAADRKEYLTGAGTKADVDEVDLKILRVVSGQGRLGTLEIARLTGLTPVQVAYRMKKIVKSRIIAGFRVNTLLDDLTFYKADFQLKSMRKKQEMLAFASSDVWSAYVDETIGFADFEMGLLCPSYQDFKRSVGRFRKRFFAEIRGYNFEIYSRIVKIRYF